MTDIFVMKNISIRRSITFNLVKLTQIEKETTLLPPCGETTQAKLNKLHRILSYSSVWCFIKELRTRCFPQGSKLFSRPNTVIAKVSFTLVLIDFPDGNLPVPSLLLQEALEQTDQQQSESLFLTPLLHADKMLTGDPSPPLVWCIIWQESKRENTALIGQTHTTMFQSLFPHCHCDIYLSSTGDWRQQSTFARLAPIDHLSFTVITSQHFCEQIRIYIWSMLCYILMLTVHLWLKYIWMKF